MKKTYIKIKMFYIFPQINYIQIKYIFILIVYSIFLILLKTSNIFKKFLLVT